MQTSLRNAHEVPAWRHLSGGCGKHGHVFGRACLQTHGWQRMHEDEVPELAWFRSKRAKSESHERRNIRGYHGCDESQKAVFGRVCELKHIDRLEVLSGAVLCLCSSEPLSLLPNGNKGATSSQQAHQKRGNGRGTPISGFFGQTGPWARCSIRCLTFVWVKCMKCVHA